MTARWLGPARGRFAHWCSWVPVHTTYVLDSARLWAVSPPSAVTRGPRATCALGTSPVLLRRCWNAICLRNCDRSRYVCLSVASSFFARCGATAGATNAAADNGPGPCAAPVLSSALPPVPLRPAVLLVPASPALVPSPAPTPLTPRPPAVGLIAPLSPFDVSASAPAARGCLTA